MLDKILIVDDDVNTRDMFYEVLSSQGYKVTCVPMAEEALLRLQEDRPGLIILDETLPRMGGMEAAAKIREFDKDIKIVMLSDGEVTEAKSEAAASLNIRGVIKKDFSTHFMMKSILAVLKEKMSVETGDISASGSRGPILVVDDNAEIRDVLWGFLTRRGYKVLAASSGEQAVMTFKVEKEKPRVVLLDVRMPGMDGIVVAKKIRELDASVKIVMITSAQEEYIMQEAMKAGACDYLIKPFDLQNLDALIASLLISYKKR